jgi:hypothetical protein
MSLIHLPIDWRERHTAYPLPVQSGRVQDGKIAGVVCANGGFRKGAGVRYVQRPLTAGYKVPDIKLWRLNLPPKGGKGAVT